MGKKSVVNGDDYQAIEEEIEKGSPEDSESSESTDNVEEKKE